MSYWLMKSEPDCFSIDALQAKPGQTEHWDGVRNYQARNMMRDEMQLGDQVFFYHSNCKETGIVGIMEVVKTGYPDHTAADPDGDHFDPKHASDTPRWYMVDVKFKRRFDRTITLAELKNNPHLTGMQLLKKGNRLSVLPIKAHEWQHILAML